MNNTRNMQLDDDDDDDGDSNSVPNPWGEVLGTFSFAFEHIPVFIYSHVRSPCFKLPKKCGF